jgi:hypothetical protein
MNSDGKGNKMTVWLSAKGLKNIQMKEYEKDSTFVVGGFRHSCPRFVAQFISPRVSPLHSIDDTIPTFEIAVDGSGCHFSQLLSGSISISDSTQNFLMLIAMALENTELYLSVQEELNVGHIIDRLLCLSSLDGDVSSEVAFFGSHFNEISDD